MKSVMHFIAHRLTKVYLNCDQCIRDGKITSVMQPDVHDYVILVFCDCGIVACSY